MPQSNVKTSVKRNAGASSNLLADVVQTIIWKPVDWLRPYPGNPRRHPEAQIAALMKSIMRRWTNPILIDEAGVILSGHGRLEAAKRLGLRNVPTLTLSGLSESEKRSLVISENKLGERAIWDFDLLREHFKGLIEINFDVELTGFSTGEIDLMLDSTQKPNASDPDDELPDVTTNEEAITQAGDIWCLGAHRVLCGDALSKDSYRQLMGSDVAQAMVTDPPYNLKIHGQARGRGKVRHREFAMASGEMSEPEFSEFLTTFMCHAIAASADGSLSYFFMDWRHLPPLLDVGRQLYTEWKNLLVWNKSNAGQGSFYRSKHELIAVFKHGTKPHINNFGLGSEGRYRTNVLDCPGANTLSLAGGTDLDLHPTVKPLALIADLIRDCSKRNGIILDPFGGSGTAILAAERTGRVARLIEMDPGYVDTTIRRWEKMARGKAVLEATGETFAEIAQRRAVPGSIDKPAARQRSPRAGRR
jgi:DNA modification methylase